MYIALVIGEYVVFPDADVWVLLNHYGFFDLVFYFPFKEEDMRYLLQRELVIFCIYAISVVYNLHF